MDYRCRSVTADERREEEKKCLLQTSSPPASATPSYLLHCPHYVRLSATFLEVEHNICTFVQPTRPRKHEAGSVDVVVVNSSHSLTFISWMQDTVMHCLKIQSRCKSCVTLNLFSPEFQNGDSE